MRSRGYADERQLFAGRIGEGLDDLGLGNRARVGDIERVADRVGLLHRPQHAVTRSFT